MLVHLVLIKLKPGVTRDDPRVKAIRADLDAYGPNPEHQRVVAIEREIADWVICDYEVAG